MTHPDDLLVDASEALQAPLSEPPGSQQAPPSSPDPTLAEELAAPKEFDPRYRQPFEGLMYLGQLDDDVTVWGHAFHLVTPSQLERMQIGVLHKPYADTLSSEIAFETVLVAAYLHSVDGKDLPQPVMNGAKDTALRDRFDWVTENLRRPVISQIYERCLVLEEQVDEVLVAMGEARG